MKRYPKEDRCQYCGKHLGWIMSPKGETVALGNCGGPKCKKKQKKEAMRTIYKYKLTSDYTTLQMPDAEILSVQYQGNDLCLWATVNPESKPRNHTIQIFGTGHEMSDHPKNYIGTVQKDGFVWHVFEMI